MNAMTIKHVTITVGCLALFLFARGMYLTIAAKGAVGNTFRDIREIFQSVPHMAPEESVEELEQSVRSTVQDWLFGSVEAQGNVLLASDVVVLVIVTVSMVLLARRVQSMDRVAITAEKAG